MRSHSNPGGIDRPHARHFYSVPQVHTGPSDRATDRTRWSTNNILCNFANQFDLGPPRPTFNQVRFGSISRSPDFSLGSITSRGTGVSPMGRVSRKCSLVFFKLFIFPSFTSFANLSRSYRELTTVLTSISLKRIIPSIGSEQEIDS